MLDMAKDKFRVLLAVENELDRFLLTYLLKKSPFFDVAGEASDPLSASEMVRRLQPDVVILEDWALESSKMSSVLQCEFPEIRIIDFSMLDTSILSSLKSTIPSQKRDYLADEDFWLLLTSALQPRAEENQANSKSNM
jgi:DNA-binding NarL/FixJ family response regulator